MTPFSVTKAFNSISSLAYRLPATHQKLQNRIMLCLCCCIAV